MAITYLFSIALLAFSKCFLAFRYLFNAPLTPEPPMREEEKCEEKVSGEATASIDQNKGKKYIIRIETKRNELKSILVVTLFIRL